MASCPSPNLSRGRRTPSPVQEKDVPLGDVVVIKEPVYRLTCIEQEAFEASQYGDYDRAVSLRMQAVALAKLCLADPQMNLPDRDDLLPKAHINLSNSYYDMQFADQACWHAQKAMELCNMSKEDQSLIVLALLSLAKGLLQKGDTNCINYLQRALVLNQGARGEEDLSNAAIHEAYGDYYIFLGDRKSDKDGSRGYSRPGTAEDMATNVFDFEPTDEYEKAMAELSKAWELIDKNPQSHQVNEKTGELHVDHPLLGTIHAKMARTRAKQRRYPEALEDYDHAIRIHTASPFLNYSAIAQLNYELGYVYHKLKKYEESFAALEKAAEFCEQQHETGREHPLTTPVKKQQGITMFDAGNLQEALQAFDELLQVQRNQNGGGSIPVAETLKYLGDVSIAMKNTNDACRYYNRSLKILRKRLGANDQTVKQLVNYIKQLNLELDVTTIYEKD